MSWFGFDYIIDLSESGEDCVLYDIMKWNLVICFGE